MAQNQVLVSCAQNAWTQLTNADATSIGFQVRVGSVEVRYTTNTTPPASTDRGRMYGPGEGELNTALTTLTDLAAAARVWAKPLGEAANVFVDHA